MMKQRLCSLPVWYICLSVGLTLLLSANTTFSQVEVKRVIEKNYDIQEDGRLAIDNVYGNIKINTWQKSQLEMKVTILAKGDDKDYVTERVSEVDIIIAASHSSVEAETNIPSPSWWKQLIGNSAKVEVHYEIRAPEKLNLSLVNDYGTIYLDKTYGATDINCDYGAIKLGELHHTRNEINIDYCHGAAIDYCNRAEINMDYSKISISKANRLSIIADYCTNEIGSVQEMEYNGDYGSLEIEEVGELDINADYLNLDVNLLAEKVIYNGDYGSFSIDHILPTCTIADFDADYVSLRIGVDEACDFRVYLEKSYTSLSISKGLLTKFHQIGDDKSKYEGIIGSDLTENKLVFSLAYGKLRLHPVQPQE